MVITLAFLVVSQGELPLGSGCPDGEVNDLTTKLSTPAEHAFPLFMGEVLCHEKRAVASSFRPDEKALVLRAYVRQRGMLVKESARHIQHMQKALEQMK